MIMSLPLSWTTKYGVVYCRPNTEDGSSHDAGFIEMKLIKKLE